MTRSMSCGTRERTLVHRRRWLRVKRGVAPVANAARLTRSHRRRWGIDGTDAEGGQSRPYGSYSDGRIATAGVTRGPAEAGVAVGSGLNEGSMIHGYHVIWGAYGFWLPNDPRARGPTSWGRGNWPASAEPRGPSNNATSIQRNGRHGGQPPSKRSGFRRSTSPACKNAGRWKRFRGWCGKSHLTIWACSILPEHVHLIIARHTYKVEQICNLLKGEATKQLKAESLHPQQRFQCGDGKLPSLWGEGQWKVYLDNEEAIEEAIRYVEQNPMKEGKPPQKWSFVTPFAGVEQSGWTTYH